MIELTDEMRDLLAAAITDAAPCTVATASASGEPDIAFKGSMMVWDGDHLAYWERARGQTMRNLEENGQICVQYVNFQKRIGWKFFGKTWVLQDGDLREQIMARTTPLELDRDPERKGAAVLIQVDRVLQAGKVIMEREPADAPMGATPSA